MKAIGRWAARLAAAGTFVFASAALADDGVNVTFDGYGGLSYEVTPSGMSLYTSAVRRSGSVVEAPYASAWRTGCLVVSPELIINHDDGRADFTPDVAVSWSGPYDPGQLDRSWVMGLRVTIRHDGEAPRNLDRSVFAGELALRPYADSPVGLLYIGSKNNRPEDLDALSVGGDVRRGDRVQLSICNLGPGTSLSIRSLDLHSYPRE